MFDHHLNNNFIFSFPERVRVCGEVEFSDSDDETESECDFLFQIQRAYDK